MKKETLIAIFLGVLAGLGVAVVMIQKAREHQMTSAQSITTSVSTTPSVAKNTQFQPLEISEPETASISSDKSTNIKGKANKGSLLVIQSPMQSTMQKLDKDEFTISNFPLSLGENTIRVSMYPKDTQIPPQEKELKVYYLDEQ